MLLPGVVVHRHENSSGPAAHYTLDKAEAAKIAHNFAPITYDAGGSADYIATIKQKLTEALPKPLYRTLHDFGTGIKRPPYVLIKGVPTDIVTRIPGDGENSQNCKSGCLSENVTAAFGEMIGYTYSMMHEGKALVNELRPNKKHAGRPTGEGFDTDLKIHVENARQKWPSNAPDDANGAPAHTGSLAPTALLLSGLSEEPDGHGPPTYTADCEAAMRKLPSEIVDTLHKPYWTINSPHRWWETQGEHIDKGAAIVPVVSGTPQAPEFTLALYNDMMKVRSDIPAAEQHKAYVALNALETTLERDKVAVHMHAGSILILDNHATGHARGPFPRLPASFTMNQTAGNETQKPNEVGRWLLRVNTTNSPRNFSGLERYRDPASGVVRDRVFVPPNQAGKGYGVTL